MKRHFSLWPLNLPDFVKLTKNESPRFLTIFKFEALQFEKFLLKIIFNTLKAQLPFPLIQFEDARIRIENFFSRYTFKELSSYQHDYQLFLTHCAKRQAYKLFGAVDFLGNPLGLAHDIKEGFNGVMKHGDFTHVIQGIEFVFNWNASNRNQNRADWLLFLSPINSSVSPIGTRPIGTFGPNRNAPNRNFWTG